MGYEDATNHKKKNNECLIDTLRSLTPVERIRLAYVILQTIDESAAVRQRGGPRQEGEFMRAVQLELPFVE